jgi:predicted RNA binding protein YcfA (HicA-like mRNA interferase family)
LPKSYPILTLSEILEIVKGLKLEKVNQVGSHQQWQGIVKEKTVKVTVDVGIVEFDIYLLKSMISQANVSKKEFYSLSKSGCRKLNLKYKKTSS